VYLAFVDTPKIWYSKSYPWRKNFR